jgi:hypothetical protein
MSVQILLTLKHFPRNFSVSKNILRHLAYEHDYFRQSNIFFFPGLNRGPEATSGPVLLLGVLVFVVLVVKEGYGFYS